MIADDIRQADTEAAIYSSLTAYIERVRSCGELNDTPECITSLPVSGSADVSVRFDQLVSGLDAASRQLDDRACVGIKEALHIFGTALSRLRALERSSAGAAAGSNHDSFRFAPPAAPPAGAAADAQGSDNA